MANKMTKRMVIEGLMNGTIEVNSDVAMNYFTHEIELLDKKSASKSNKPSAKSIENDGYRDTILGVLEGADTPLSLSEIKALCGDAFAEFSPQKMSGIIKPLCDSHVVVKTMEKRVAKFALA